MPDEKTLKGKFTYRAKFWGNDYAESVEYEPGPGETFEDFWSVAADERIRDKKGLAEHEHLRKLGELAIGKAKAEKKISEIPLKKDHFYIMISWMDYETKQLAFKQSKVHPDAKYKIKKDHGRDVYGFWPKDEIKPEPEIETDKRLDKLCEDLGKGVWRNKKLGDTNGICDFNKWYRKEDCILLFPTRTAFNKAVSDFVKKRDEGIPAKRQKIDQAEAAFKVIKNKTELEKAIFTASNWERIPGRPALGYDYDARITYLDEYFKYVGML